MDVTRRWIQLAYRLPREPSTPRIAVWRRLRRLGVAQLLDGLVALPLDDRNREQLEWLAEEVTQAGGTASLWLAEPVTATQDRELRERLTRAIAAEYRDVTAQARAAAASPRPERHRALLRLRRGLARIRRRDYFPPPEREEARRAVEALGGDAQEAAA